jgi:hypothetical protein
VRCCAFDVLVAPRAMSAVCSSLTSTRRLAGMPTMRLRGGTLRAVAEEKSVHLDRGYDSNLTRERLEELGLGWEISGKGRPAPFWAAIPATMTEAIGQQRNPSLPSLTHLLSHEFPKIIALRPSNLTHHVEGVVNPRRVHVERGRVRPLDRLRRGLGYRQRLARQIV